MGVTKTIQSSPSDAVGSSMGSATPARDTNAGSRSGSGTALKG